MIKDLGFPHIRIKGAQPASKGQGEVINGFIGAVIKDSGFPLKGIKRLKLSLQAMVRS